MADFFVKFEHLLHNHFWSFGAIVSFIIGSCVGSFLNVCIWRIPRGESVSHPPSHCPKCGYQIPAYENIPIIAWLMLRGKCKNCGTSISPRYIIIEAFVGFLFIWVSYAFTQTEYALGLILFFWSMTAVFVTVSFIDVEHYRIPDNVNIYAAITLLPLFIWAPQFLVSNSDLSKLHQFLPFTESLSPSFQALAYSLLGAFCSFFILWSMVYVGRMFKKTQELSLDEEVQVKVNQDGIYSLEDGQWEEALWKDIALKNNETITYSIAEGSLNLDQVSSTELVIDSSKKALISGEHFDPKDKELSFSAKSVVFPIDVIGQGDLKYVLILGAFLGPQMGILSIFFAAVFGAIVGLMQIVKSKKVSSAILPFGPFLSISAFLCLLYKNEILQFLNGLGQ